MRVYIAFILIIFTMTQDINPICSRDINPINKMDCFDHDPKCCFVFDDPLNPYCSYKDDLEKKNTTINVICKELEMYTSCEQSKIEYYTDCTKNSIENNSCCFFESKGTKGCFWMGENHVGIKKWKDMTIQCSSLNYKSSFIILILIIIIL